MDGLVKVENPDGTYVKYSYDDSCRLTKVTTPFGSTSYEYDLLDNLAENVKKGYSIMRIIYNEVSNEILNFIA